jgi:hypothetical protein
MMYYPYLFRYGYKDKGEQNQRTPRRRIPGGSLGGQAMR